MAREKRQLRRFRRLKEMQPEENAFVPRGANRRPWAIVKEDVDGEIELGADELVPPLTDLEAAQAVIEKVILVLKAGSPDEAAVLQLHDELGTAVELILPEERAKKMLTNTNKAGEARKAELQAVIKSLKKLSVETSGTDLNLADQVDAAIGQLETIVKDDAGVDPAASAIASTVAAPPASMEAMPVVAPPAIVAPEAVAPVTVPATVPAVTPAAAVVAAVAADPGIPALPGTAPEAAVAAAPVVAPAATPAALASTLGTPAVSGIVTKEDLEEFKKSILSEVTKTVRESMGTLVVKSSGLPAVAPASQVPGDGTPALSPQLPVSSPQTFVHSFDLASSPELAQMDYYGQPKAR